MSKTFLDVYDGHQITTLAANDIAVFWDASEGRNAGMLASDMGAALLTPTTTTTAATVSPTLIGYGNSPKTFDVTAVDSVTGFQQSCLIRALGADWTETQSIGANGFFATFSCTYSSGVVSLMATASTTNSITYTVK